MSPRFRVLIAGCGEMAKTWVAYAASREDTEIVALVDPDAKNAEAMRVRHNLACPTSGDLNAALKTSGANLVFDVTPPAAHEGVVLAALQAGCDVLGEKPLAAGMDAARRMCAAAEKAGKTYAVMQNRRYLPGIRAYRDLVTSGVIGRLGLLGADFFLAPHFGGFRDVMDSPLLLDMAIHTFDQARFISGADAVSAHCLEFNPPGSWYAGKAAAVCAFELSNGAVFSYRGSWCAEGLNTSWEAEWRACASLGAATWNGVDPPRAEVVRDAGQPGFTRDVIAAPAPAPWTGREGHQGCLDEMFDALIRGAKPQTDCQDNIKSLAMVFAAVESARSGLTVRL